MIFLLSKRAYLNVICPLTDKNVLLNANYYIADCPSPNRVADELEDELNYDPDTGRWVKSPKETTGIKSATTYLVKYGTGCINPGPQVVDLISRGLDGSEFEQRVIDVLRNPNIMKSIYEEIYLSPKRGNGILFIIYYIDENITNWGHIIANHLAQCFGEDITFVDPKYRPYVKGQLIYPGNKEFSEKVIKDLEDYRIMSGFLQSVKQSPGLIEDAVSNMTTYMSTYNFRDATKLYELLFPHDPLPRGNYTLEQVKEIIIARMIDSRMYMPVGNDNRISVIERYRPGYGY